ncbi:TonB-dependent receptor [Rhodanobacter lindaniclasticus]|uniref:TonB-dependent receptor n=1 Tax=Rhodanobacter lindaniclasticus TaxID=75310 RepID=A0A4S3KHA3_9GAMM|nr:TonB-dependent receptor [Rhodanobacter lindaniclasticus]THD07959.1 TonB-dependent receptor [Rhodanobacter lindaniclasticus]
MKASPIALALAAALLAGAVHATEPTPMNTGAPAADGSGGGSPLQVRELGEVSVSAALDQARNVLSPDTGSSQYVIDHKAIVQLPLGASTPMNQVLLQAPGVVQDSYGGVHVRGDHANLQYRINGVIIPESIGGFGQSLDAHMIDTVTLLDGALPAQYGLRTAAVVDITTRSGRDLGDGGSVGITGGSNAMLNPSASVWGSKNRWSWFFTGNYLESDAGIENPTPSKKPIHDRTNQVKGFGDISYLIDDDTRMSLLFGAANNRYQIPNNPDQVPAFGYLDTVDFDSADLDQRQRETTRFGVLALQGKLGVTDYQLSLGQRYSRLAYTPDRIGELMFNGVASAVGRSNRASTLQADFSTPLGGRHTLRYGIWGSIERAVSGNDAWVFPADADGEQTSTTPINILDGSRLVAKTWSAYVQDEWSLGENWTLNLGLRGDRYQLVRSESQLSPRLGLVWQAGGGTTVHAGYSRYFTPPATEMIASSNIAKFDGTTNAVADSGNNTPLAERSGYFDAGIQQRLGEAWTLGVDAYYRKVRRLQDEGQFGSALVYSTFNYADGRVKGVEFTVNYEQGPLSAYFNASLGKAIGKRIISSQYNFAPDDLVWVSRHWIFLDHDQKLTSSGGVSYALDDATRLGANYLYGSGLRKDGTVPNGATLPAYFQLNLNVAHDFVIDGFGRLHAQLALINALDRTYELRDGSGIGVGAPQFGPRRGVYLGLQKDF